MNAFLLRPLSPGVQGKVFGGLYLPILQTLLEVFFFVAFFLGAVLLWAFFGVAAFLGKALEAGFF